MNPLEDPVFLKWAMDTETPFGAALVVADIVSYSQSKDNAHLESALKRLEFLRDPEEDFERLFPEMRWQIKHATDIMFSHYGLDRHLQNAILLVMSKDTILGNALAQDRIKMLIRYGRVV